jgi:hypothetical protein
VQFLHLDDGHVKCLGRGNSRDAGATRTRSRALPAGVR